MPSKTVLDFSFRLINVILQPAGLVGRFKLSPEYLNAKQKSSKKKPAAAKTKTILQRKRRSKAPDVNTEKLTSLKETSVAAKVRK